ncbi:TonB-dependent receptor [Pelagicoccus sp. SDUM812002]|uniref:TonB-dependent siderophore receptor n=1 Tax=Pelagicoccus sp. SDUM812002 TaxID=3041266 RepID=UPI00280E85C6|nr:TonB-dependent receptor [Pelagicoccus sp. SDUM812002]MDQ8187976.1 TonB-dependent receptor [Pelagicoccus sp. SDUM812002]
MKTAKPTGPVIHTFRRCGTRETVSFLTLLTGAILLNAQSVDEPVILETFTVSAAEADIYEVLPTRPSSTSFGTPRELIETPRSLTQVESATADLFGIRTVNDFVAVTAGSFTGNYFGVAGALDVRGERADNFFRGFRRIENRGNFPTPIASTDYVEIVRGPAPPVYGGGKVGGILNYIPKTAKSKTAKYIESPTNVASVTVGNYGKLMGSYEKGIPFKMGDRNGGAYLFLQAEDSNHYYDNIYNKSMLAQLAVDLELNDTTMMEFGFMLQDADLNQSLGWNRVTQELIDSEGALYYGGQAALDLDADGNGLLSPAEIEIYDLEQFAFASPFPYDALTDEQKAAFALDPSTLGARSLSHHNVQAEAIDFSQTDTYTFYFDLTKDIGDGFTLKNQSFYDSMNHTKYSSYGFTADYEAMVFENKTTLSWTKYFDSESYIDNVFGISYRYSDGEERESRGRGFQVLDRRDISLPATANDRFEGAHTGSGNVPYNWVQIGDFSDFGAFGLIDGKFGSFGFIASARYDMYDADTYGTDTSAVYDDASDTESAFTYNLSLMQRFGENLNAYATYAESSYLELGQGGMIARTNIGGGTWIQDSKLTEVGMKGTFLEKHLYATVAYYEQEKNSFDNISGAFDFYESSGIEIETRFAPTKTLSFTGAATFQKTELLNTPFFLGVPIETLGLDPALTYGGRFVGLGAIIGAPAPIEAPTPEKVLSLNATYTSPKSWGGSVGGTYVSSFYSGYAQEVTLPSYFVTRAALFYATENWSYRLNANNVLDEKYYNPQFLFWDSFVSPSVGPTFELTATYKW